MANKLYYFDQASQGKLIGYLDKLVYEQRDRVESALRLRVFIRPTWQTSAA